MRNWDDTIKGAAALALALGTLVGGCGEGDEGTGSMPGPVTGMPPAGEMMMPGNRAGGAAPSPLMPTPPMMPTPTAPLGGNGVTSTVADGEILPIVFVHGFAGSASQFQSQAMRFEANGYPVEQIVAYDHHGGPVMEDFTVGLSQVVDETLARFGASKVYLMGHSRGTGVSRTYLNQPGNADKVAKYISLDGVGCGMVPVACIAPSQGLLPGQKHVEVATSAESFAMQYEFLMGTPPTVTQIEPETGMVTVSGRVVNFPDNTGRDGAILRFYEVDPASGSRVSETPVGSFDLGADGAYGPVMLDPTKLYEREVSSTTNPSVQHVYMQRQVRSTHLERILSGPPDTDTRVNTNSGAGHAALTVIRMREWRGSDKLLISTDSEAGTEAEVDAITMSVANAMGLGAPIALHIHDDAATPGMSSLGALPWFTDQPFQDGIDVYMPAAPEPNGTITVNNIPLGETDRPQVINVPNWSSDNHTIHVVFTDYTLD